MTDNVPVGDPDRPGGGTGAAGPGPDPGGGILARLREILGERLARARADEDPNTVIEVRSAGTTEFEAFVTRLEAEHDLPVFRLALADLAAPPGQRVLAALRLLDAAEVGGAIPLLEVANHLADDPAGVVALATRLRAFPGLVVIATDAPSPLGEVVDRVIVGDVD